MEVMVGMPDSAGMKTFPQGYLWRRLLGCKCRDCYAGKMPAVRVHDDFVLPC